MPKSKLEKLTFIDLFAGAGGLSEGFIRAGFTPVAHVEIDKAACNTLRTRAAFHYLKTHGKYKVYASYLMGEISRKKLYDSVPEEVLESVINLPIGEEYNKLIQNKIDGLLCGRQVDLIIGGPPCQAYSLVGRARSASKMEGDPRNYLFIEYAKYLEIYKPKMFVFENVMGLKSAKGGEYLCQMESLFNKKGYQIKLYTLEARNFGVLQNRKRIIILGWLKNKSFKPPNLELIKAKKEYRVDDLLKDLPAITAGGGNSRFLNYIAAPTEYLKTNSLRNDTDILTQHIARPQHERDKEIYKITVQKWENDKERLNYNDLPEYLKTHQNRSVFVDRFKVVAGDLPYSQTVVAHISKDGHYYIHPDINQNRSLSVREAARLQSFPDNYFFEGEKEDASRTAAFKQIGNAVPPIMANKIADVIKKLLSSND